MISPDALILRSVGTGPWSTIFWRGALMGIGTLLLMGVVGPGVRRSRRPTPRHVLAGTLFAGATVAFVWALSRTDVATVVVIVAAGPLFAALLARLFLREAAPVRTWLTSTVVVVGLGIIFAGSLGRGEADGALIALAGSSCFAGYLTVSRGAAAADMTPAIAIG
ncbi:MAG: EamA family transporter, partial [Gemmatimonadota bacterium]